jgi:hypothetical protein
MNKIYFISIGVFVMTIFFENAASIKAIPSGVSGRSGSYTACDDCHTPDNILLNASNALITSDIPESGYIPGTVYKMMLTVKSQKNKVGFDMAIQNSAKQLVGQIKNVVNGQITTAEGTVDTGEIAGEVTHTVSTNTILQAGKVVTFDWVAPAKGTGKVDWWASVGTGIVYPYMDTLNKLKVSFSEDVAETTNISDVEVEPFYVYPTETKDMVSIRGYNTSNKMMTITIRNHQGQNCKSLYFSKGTICSDIYCGELPNGNYVVQTEINSKVKSYKFIINK